MSLMKLESTILELYALDVILLEELAEGALMEDGLPQMVMKTIQQGIMIVQQQVPNPKRIEKYCKVCNCWDDEYGCFKQGNGRSIPTCRNYIERE